MQKRDGLDKAKLAVVVIDESLRRAFGHKLSRVIGINPAKRTGLRDSPLFQSGNQVLFWNADGPAQLDHRKVLTLGQMVGLGVAEPKEISQRRIETNSTICYNYQTI